MNLREAEALLPWYVAGTLDAEEAQAVKAFIDSGAIPPAALTELDELQAEVASDSHEPAYDPAILNRVMAQLDAIPQEAPAEDPLVVLGERGAGPTSSDGSEGLTGYFRRLADRLGWSQTPAFARVAVGAQFLLVLGLAAALLFGDGTPADTEYATVAGPERGDLAIVFAPGATESDIRTLLRGRALRLVDGPSALGVYRVDAPDEADLAALQQALRESPLVQVVTP